MFPTPESLPSVLCHSRRFLGRLQRVFRSAGGRGLSGLPDAGQSHPAHAVPHLHHHRRGEDASRSHRLRTLRPLWARRRLTPGCSVRRGERLCWRCRSSSAKEASLSNPINNLPCRNYHCGRVEVDPRSLLQSPPGSRPANSWLDVQPTD